MFRVGAVICSAITLVAMITFTVSGCQALSTTGQALDNGRTQIAQKSEGSTRIPLNSDDMEADKLGDLGYLGGLKLTSRDKRFGGLSGLVVSDDGTRFLSVSDKGNWVRGKLLYRDRTLVGVRDIEIFPMLGPDGRTVEGKALGDAESLVGDLDGRVLVSFEGTPRIWSYDLSKGDFANTPTPIALPADTRHVKNNGGLEGIAHLQDKAGTILALTEDTMDDAGNMKGWLIRPDGSFSVSLKANRPFKLTDLAALPNGDVLTLERRFTPMGGPGFQIRRIDGGTIQPGATLDGSVVASAGLPWSVDNMEGLDIRRDEDGKLIVYIVSDDNFNPLQRTLLLMFELQE